MVRLGDLVEYLDDYLRNREEVADAPEALNGLQVANGGEVTRIAAAVDLCGATVRLAAEQRADLLLVHHGMFWGGLRPVVGPVYARLAGLIRNNIALYSAHLPLDRHPQVGNNILLARMLGLEVRGDFGEYHGAPIGVWGEYAKSREDLTASITRALGVAPRVLPLGPEKVRRVGVVTGSGGSLIAQAAAAGLDTFVTGEGKHSSFFDAEELGVNVFLAGHYATETLGVKALAEHVSAKFSVPWVFLDHPTGL